MTPFLYPPKKKQRNEKRKKKDKEFFERNELEEKDAIEIEQILDSCKNPNLILASDC